MTPNEPERRVSSPQGNEGATRPDVCVARRASTQHGVVAKRQLRQCGLDGKAIANRVRRGHLHPIFRGVYAVGHDGLTSTGRFAASVLACGEGAVLSDHAAGAHLELRTGDDDRRTCNGGDRRPQVTVPRAGGRKIDGIRVHRRNLDARDVWTRDGIRVTSPARTILDMAATMSAAELRRMVRQAQAERRVNMRQLLDVLARHRGHRGAGRLRAVIADGATPTRSVLEDHVLDLIVQAGIERPEINAQLVLGDRPIEPDMLWRRHWLVVECDGRRWHCGALAQEDDAERQALLEAHGYRVLRITWNQAVHHPQQTVARIRAALVAAPPPEPTGA